MKLGPARAALVLGALLGGCGSAETETASTTATSPSTSTDPDTRADEGEGGSPAEHLRRAVAAFEGERVAWDHPLGAHVPRPRGRWTTGFVDGSGERLDGVAALTTDGPALLRFVTPIGHASEYEVIERQVRGPDGALDLRMGRERPLASLVVRGPIKDDLGAPTAVGTFHMAAFGDRVVITPRPGEPSRTEGPLPPGVRPLRPSGAELIGRATDPRVTMRSWASPRSSTCSRSACSGSG